MDLSSHGDDVPFSPFSTPPEANHLRHAMARRRRQRRDAWLAATAMLGALLALPPAQSAWHGAEVSAVLAIAATAQFAGHRWAIAVIVIAELFLLPAVAPRAFLESEPAPRIVALITLAAMLPSLCAMRRAAAVLVALTGQRPRRQAYRWIHAGLVVSCAIAVVAPWL